MTADEIVAWLAERKASEHDLAGMARYGIRVELRLRRASNPSCARWPSGSGAITGSPVSSGLRAGARRACSRP